MFITLIYLMLFIKCNVLDFKETKEFKYIQKNKNIIEKIIVRTDTLFREHCYKIDKNKGYNILNIIFIKREVNIHCMDSDTYLEVYFKDGTNRKILFE